MDSFKSWTKNEELKSWARDTVASIENCAERMKDKRLSDKDRDSFCVMLVQLSQAIKHDDEYPNNLAMRDMSNWLLDAFDALINDDVVVLEAKYEILRQLSFFGEVLVSEEARAAYEPREDGRTYIDFIPSSLTNEQSNQIVEHLQSIGAKFDTEVGQWYVEADWKMPELLQGEQENKNERQSERLNGEEMEYKIYYEDKLIGDVAFRGKEITINEALKRANVDINEVSPHHFDWEKVKIECDGRLYSWKLLTFDLAEGGETATLSITATEDGKIVGEREQIYNAYLIKINNEYEIFDATPKEGKFNSIVYAFSTAIENVINERAKELVINNERKNEHSKKGSFSVLIQNRTEFENGNPAGVYLSLPATKAELYETMKELNITAEKPHDFLINGYSIDENSTFISIDLPSDWIRDGDLDKINFLAAKLEEMTSEQFEKLNAIMHSDFKPSTLDALINHTFNTDYFSFVPGILSYKDLGDYFLNDSGKVQMPEHWRASIDKADFATNVAINEDGKLTDYGYIARSGVGWKEIFTGKEIPEQYCIMSFPEQERTNQEQDMTEKQENITNDAKYKAIYYDGKDRKEIFADSKDHALQAVQEAKPGRKETERCYIQEREADSENYKNEGIYLIESGRDVTPVEVKIPRVAKEIFKDITENISKMGANFNGNKKCWYVERSMPLEEMAKIQGYIDSKTQYKAIYYDGKDRKEIFADSKDHALQAVQEAKPGRKETERCYIQEREADSKNYKQEGIYLIESGKKVESVKNQSKASVHAKLEQNKKTAEQSEQGKDRSIEPKNKDNHERA